MARFLGEPDITKLQNRIDYTIKIKLTKNKTAVFFCLHRYAAKVNKENKDLFVSLSVLIC